MTWLLDPVLLLPLALLALLAAAIAAVAIARRVRARRRARRRVVEKPNSHYTPRIVRENEARHRWRDIALDRMHEINREEVERLLAKVEAAGVAVLTPKEREFLDYMAELVGRKPDSGSRPSGERRDRPRGRHGRVPRDLGHDPA
ncbi:MAG: hypothetical protein ACOC9N_02320 [Gemmatimonadota bacterium]